jgi:predicted hotdog family 3-hydroxylacyl-ACP dehydratase
VGLDLLAQAAAALATLRRRHVDREARGEVGYLVGVREAHFEAATLPLAVPLIAHVRITGEAASVATHEVSLWLGDALCISAILTTFRSSSRP